MMSSVNLYAFHGFLGSPTDWYQFAQVTHPIAIDHEELSLEAWAAHFSDNLRLSAGKNILLGYSLGGRLAMHVLLANPSFWNGAIFVSAHPGLSLIEERESRWKADVEWAQRFLNDPWDKVWTDWNANPIFSNESGSLLRGEFQFDRKKLSQQLKNWSLAHQRFLLPELQKLATPMLYIAGECDSKFCDVAKQFESIARVAIIPKAKHRVPWDQPEQFMHQINQFIEDI
ncbi:MAG: alpha/beta fold hydrolase [Parachlamydiaceae bacterium]